MVFLIQNTQNRDAKALHLKLNELIRSNQGARNTMVDNEEVSDDALERLQKQFRKMSEHYANLSGQIGGVADILDDNDDNDDKPDDGNDLFDE